MHGTGKDGMHGRGKGSMTRDGLDGMEWEGMAAFVGTAGGLVREMRRLRAAAAAACSSAVLRPAWRRRPSAASLPFVDISRLRPRPRSGCSPPRTLPARRALQVRLRRNTIPAGAIPPVCGRRSAVRAAAMRVRVAAPFGAHVARPRAAAPVWRQTAGPLPLGRSAPRFVVVGAIHATSRGIHPYATSSQPAGPFHPNP